MWTTGMLLASKSGKIEWMFCSNISKRRSSEFSSESNAESNSELSEERSVVSIEVCSSKESSKIVLSTIGMSEAKSSSSCSCKFVFSIIVLSFSS